MHFLFTYPAAQLLIFYSFQRKEERSLVFQWKAREVQTFNLNGLKSTDGKSGIESSESELQMESSG